MNKDSDQWTELIKLCLAPSEFPVPLFKGVPRHHRGEIWKFLAEQFHLKHPFPSKQQPRDVPYKELLKQLTSQQHAILIDLGKAAHHTKKMEISLPGKAWGGRLRCGVLWLLVFRFSNLGIIPDGSFRCIKLCCGRSLLSPLGMERPVIKAVVTAGAQLSNVQVLGRL